MSRDRTFPPKILRWSELKHMARSPAHMRAAFTHPKEPHAVMRIGRIGHFLAIGGKSLVVYEGERRGNAWKDFKARHDGKEIVTSGEVERAQPIADAITSHPLVLELGLLDGEKEKELTWTGHLGRACAGTIDVLRPLDTVEIKITSNSSPERFTWQSARMLYHGQNAWYRDGARKNGYAIERAWCICVESEPPYEVTVFHLTPRLLDEGDKMIRLLVERVEACEREGVWPGYVQRPVPLDLPNADADVTLTVGGEAMDL